MDCSEAGIWPIVLFGTEMGEGTQCGKIKFDDSFRALNSNCCAAHPDPLLSMVLSKFWRQSRHSALTVSVALTTRHKSSDILIWASALAGAQPVPNQADAAFDWRSATK